MRIEIPNFCLVALIGATSSGKSTFAAKHFKPTEVLSSDYFRGLISDDESDQSCTTEAFDALYYVARKRLDAMKLTVIDATNVQEAARKQVIALAKEENCHPVAIVFHTPEAVCKERNAVDLIGNCAGGAVAAADIGRSRAEDRALCALCPA